MSRSIRSLAIAAAFLASASSANAALTISGGTTKNVSCISGVCTATAEVADLNSNDLETMLASSNVQVEPSSVAMDIVVNTGVTWASGYTLTLDAYQSLSVAEPVDITGTGGLSILTNDGGSGGDYTFGPKGKVTFLGTSNSLTINGTSFTLLGSMSDVQNINTNLNGNYALANSYNASHVTGWVPLGTDGMGNIANSGFAGTFEGLGHTISNLKVNIGSTAYAGLFGFSEGTIRDVGIVGGSVIGKSYVGGLMGLQAQGTIAHAYSTASVGKMNFSYKAGGLVGESYESTINDSYATGAVTGGGSLGGLVGINATRSAISSSFATGIVTATAQNGAGTGGLVGYEDGGGYEDSSLIEDSYATGAVPGTTELRGGLVGVYNYGQTSIVESYSTGMIDNSARTDGGFVGCTEDDLSNDYWDTQTSGIGGSQGNGCGANWLGITGLTTAQLQSGLPAGFDPTIWAENPSINGGFPYLINNPPPQQSRLSRKAASGSEHQPQQNAPRGEACGGEDGKRQRSAVRHDFVGVTTRRREFLSVARHGSLRFAAGQHRSLRVAEW